MAGTESERPSVACETEVVEIPSDLVELAVVRSKARPSDGLSEGDLEWPCPEDPVKVRFILRDSQECQLKDILGQQGHAAMSELATLSAKLGDM